MARRTWLCVAAMVALLGCEVGDDPDVDFDGGLFDDDAGIDEQGDGDGDGDAVGDGDVGDDDGGVDMGDGDVGDGDGDSTEPDPTPEDWPRLFAGATCSALEDCMGEEVLFEQLGRDCRALKENLLRSGELAFLPNSVAAGLVTFVPEALPECLDAIAGLGCAAEAARLPASCEAAIVGNVAFGDPCTINEDCEGDNFCDHDEGCDGICVPPLPEDGVCTRNDDAQCEDGLNCFCSDRDALGGCNVDATCRPFGDVGDPCFGENPACTPGLLCLDFGIDVPLFECATVDTLYSVAEDEACEAGIDLCAPPLVCESTGAGAEGLCKPRVGEDATCRRGDPDPCPPHQFCEADAPGVDGTCVDRPGDGEPCLSPNRTPRCIEGTRCIDGSCVLLKQNGDGCETPRECYSGACEGMVCTGPAMCEAP